MASADRGAAAAPVRARLWDGPTRIVHWAIVALVAFAWWSGDSDHLEWHRWAGYGVLGLVAFRLLWGLAGGQSARFASFVRGPRATLAYLRSLPSRSASELVGHNPLGAWSVLAILAVLIFQVVTGLFAVDVDALDGGPLSDRISFDLGRRIAHWHHWSFWAIEALVALHVAAVAFYLIYKRSNLIGPMITGRRSFAQDPGLRFAPIWTTVLCAAVAVAFAWWVSRGFRI